MYKVYVQGIGNDTYPASRSMSVCGVVRDNLGEG